MKKLILGVLMLCMYGIAMAQNNNEVEIRFKRDSVDCDTRRVCYLTQFRTVGTVPVNLGGVNYRIYYNSSRAVMSSVHSLLPSPQYGALSLVNDAKDMDATGYGSLSFEATLGFLNYAIDLSDVANGGVDIPVDNWLSTTRLCFNVEQEVIDDPSLCLEAVWGRDGYTDGYATAFVEVSHWISTNRTAAANIVNYSDLSSGSGDEACLNDLCGDFTGSTMYIDDVLTSENSGSVTLQLCINEAAAQDVSVTVHTSNGTAISGNDYIEIPETTYIIPAGQTCVPVTVTILDDDIYEGDENFQVELSNPSANVVITKGTAIVTIDDDETNPTISIEDLSVNEEDSTVGIAVSLSGKIAVPVTLKVNTVDGTANASSDYMAVINHSLTIPAGETSVNAILTIMDDNVSEPNETFSVVLSDVSAGVSIVKGTGVVTIVDDEPLPSVNASDIVVSENAGVINVGVTLSGLSSQPVTFTVNSTDGTAIVGVDYEAVVSLLVTIPSGQSSINIPVNIIDDTNPEPTKTFELIFTNLSDNAQFVKDRAVVTILDDDGGCTAKSPAISRK